jgi:plastocyanin
MRRLIGVAVVLAAFATCGQASAATWQVLVGEVTKPPAGTPKGATLNKMFPSKLQIHVGDKVTYTSRGFHTATYLAGAAPQQPFAPDTTGGKYEGINDSAGAAFYFNGLTKLLYNVAALAPSGPKTVSGKTPANSGVIVPGPNGKPVTYTYTFPKAGAFKIVCIIHPGMTGTVVVRAAGAPIPDAKAVVKQAAVETAAAWAKATPLSKTPAPANTVLAGVGGTTTLLAFLPKALTVKVGTTVRFVNKSPSEPHSMVFGPKNYILGLMKKVDLVPLGPNAPNQAAPFFPYGSDPAGVYTYDGANHGNGFLATPLIDDQPGAPPRGLAGASAITFTKAGKYHYFCLLHGPDMSGDIVVK